jgi:plasmid stabilization system protein ParE
MKVVLSLRCQSRLRDIQGYLAFHNMRAAVKAMDRIFYTFELPAEYPRI